MVLTPKICPVFFFLLHNNSILYNHLCVWILRKVFPLKMCACLCCLIKIGVLFKVCVRLCTFTKQYRTKQFKSRKQWESSDERKARRRCCLFKISVFSTFCALLSSNAEPTSLNHESSQEFRREKRKRSVLVWMRTEDRPGNDGTPLLSKVPHNSNDETRRQPRYRLTAIFSALPLSG